LSQSGERPEHVDGILALRDDAFEAELAGMPENLVARLLDMLIEL
jgi:hypothetical protein